MNITQYQDLVAVLRPKNVCLIAVSKMHPPARILEVYRAGQRFFAENRVQELLPKYEELPKDIQWHLIGHLQKNKVRQIAPFISMIHSIDSLGLLEEVNKEAAKNNRVIDCLLQFHVAAEETKFGLSQEEALALLDSEAYRQMKHIRLCGVMGMATFTDDEARIHAEFAQIRTIFQELKARYFSEQAWFKEISMGMSGDWQIAVEEGTTMVRVGSLIFG